MRIDEIKGAFRKRQQGAGIEEKIRQLYAIQQRYIALSEAAIANGLKKPSKEFLRARRLLGQ